MIPVPGKDYLPVEMVLEMFNANFNMRTITGSGSEQFQGLPEHRGFASRHRRRCYPYLANIAAHGGAVRRT